MPSLTLRRTRFRYDAVTDDGLNVSGTVRASTRAEALQQLSVHRLIPTALDDAPGLWQTDVTPERLGHGELEGFVAQLAVFTSSGVPLPTALLVIAEETDHRVLRRTATELAAQLTDGTTLGDAVDTQAHVLPAHVRGVLRSAESSGDLARALNGLHHHLERQSVARRRVVGALVYPGVVAAMAVATMGILAGFALPRFSSLFTELGANPPLAARVSQQVGTLVGTWWPVLTALAATGLGGGVWWMRSPRTARQRHWVLWRLPGIRRVVRLALAERTCRILALAMSSGVPLPVAMDLAVEVSHHAVVRDRLRTARNRMLQGENVTVVLDGTELFTPAVRQVISVGEHTGTLDQQLGVAADLLAGELDRRLHRLTALLEPALVVTVGVLVAGVAVSLVTALYGVVDQLGV